MLLPKYQNLVPEAGCDEAGRGCLAGPVVAAAVILPTDFAHPLINDSKKISEKNRYLLRTYIEKNALYHAVAFVEPSTIDRINILQASILAMHQALDQLPVRPKHIIIDGHQFNPYTDIPHTCIIKGDSLYASIAAASILAKTYRDDYMRSIDAKHPEYHWAKNKGYPTQQHRKAISINGLSPYHRKSFKAKKP